MLGEHGPGNSNSSLRSRPNGNHTGPTQLRPSCCASKWSDDQSLGPAVLVPPPKRGSARDQGPSRSPATHPRSERRGKEPGKYGRAGPRGGFLPALSLCETETASAARAAMCAAEPALARAAAAGGRASARINYARRA
ncbi:hypothetical protein SKAU_G00264990 [Synaphobranchus kaupii]|uniref:Uncharacterized protein n=1 Tax=Synaphobranchus kaupii TaxID=118154 RepID=A0A9Q1IP28_SYNKA|nr:hypothetical protein SKAU_G00264990 [Synaphobranchus kaupii]